MDTHLFAHCLIFVGYVLAVMQVPGTLSAIIDVRKVTLFAGGGFFLTCGLTHFGLAMNLTHVWWVEVNDHLQAGFILSFLWLLSIDLRNALLRLRSAYAALIEEFGEEIGGRMVQVIQQHLGGKK